MSNVPPRNPMLPAAVVSPTTIAVGSSAAVLAAPPNPALALTTSVASLSGPVAAFLAHHNLPTEDVLQPLPERKTVIDAFENAISVLPVADREKAFYLSKFVVAISVGIFDAALNYLWDETILALRGLVAQTDITYFFDVAEKSPNKRDKLGNAEDLPRIDDAVLIDACVRIGLLHPVNGERLRHVNYMRNHASAAHPNVAELNGGEMIGWLSNCLRHAITAKPDAAALQTHHFLNTIRERVIAAADVTLLEQDFRKMSMSRVDDLMWTIFGMYVDPKLPVQPRANLDAVAPVMWSLSSGRVRYAIGLRHAEYARRSDGAKRDLAMTFLKTVGGEAYRATDVLTADLIEKLRGLRAAHVGPNNFYNEAVHAAALEESLPPNGVVPKPVLYDWVFNITQCWIGNGRGYYEGVDRGALPHYEKQVHRFGDREMADFLRAVADPAWVDDLMYPKAQMRLHTLAQMFRPKAQDVGIQKGLDMILNANPSGYRSLGAATAYTAMLATLPTYS